MKATIGNIVVEGTPQEIIEYEKLKQQENNKNLADNLSKLNKYNNFYNYLNELNKLLEG